MFYDKIALNMEVSFSAWLTFQMQLKNWTQSDLARASGLTRQTISYYLSDKSKYPDENALIKIANAFKLPPEHVYRAYLAGQWDLDRYAARKQKILAEIQRLQDEQQNLLRRQVDRQAQTAALRDLQATPNLHDWLTHTDPDQVNHRLRALLHHITIGADQIEIVLK